MQNSVSIYLNSIYQRFIIHRLFNPGHRQRLQLSFLIDKLSLQIGFDRIFYLSALTENINVLISPSLRNQIIHSDPRYYRRKLFRIKTRNQNQFVQFICIAATSYSHLIKSKEKLSSV